MLPMDASYVKTSSLSVAMLASTRLRRTLTAYRMPPATSARMISTVIHLRLRFLLFALLSASNSASSFLLASSMGYSSDIKRPAGRILLICRSLMNLHCRFYEYSVNPDALFIRSKGTAHQYSAIKKISPQCISAFKQQMHILTFSFTFFFLFFILTAI